MRDFLNNFLPKLIFYPFCLLMSAALPGSCGGVMEIDLWWESSIGMKIKCDPWCLNVYLVTGECSLATDTWVGSWPVLGGSTSTSIFPTTKHRSLVDQCKLYVEYITVNDTRIFQIKKFIFSLVWINKYIMFSLELWRSQWLTQPLSVGGVEIFRNLFWDYLMMMELEEQIYPLSSCADSSQCFRWYYSPSLRWWNLY